MCSTSLMRVTLIKLNQINKGFHEATLATSARARYNAINFIDNDADWTASSSIFACFSDATNGFGAQDILDPASDNVSTPVIARVDLERFISSLLSALHERESFYPNQPVQSEEESFDAAVPGLTVVLSEGSFGPALPVARKHNVIPSFEPFQDQSVGSLITHQFCEFLCSVLFGPKLMSVLSS